MILCMAGKRRKVFINRRDLNFLNYFMKSSTAKEL